MMNLKTRSLIPLLLGIVLAVPGLGSIAVAQPDANNAPKAANPQNWNQMDMGNWQKMTPTQRQETMKKLVAQTLQGGLTAIGVTDEKTVTTIIQFAQAQEEAKQPVREKARKVLQGLMGNTRTEAQMTASMEELRQTVEEAKTSQKADIATLEELTGFSKKPKLQALLTMMGLIGDESLFTQGVLMSTMNTMSLLMEQPAAEQQAAEQ